MRRNAVESLISEKNFVESLDHPLYYTIIALFGAMIFVVWLTRKTQWSVALLTFGRWIRATFFSLVMAAFLNATLGGRPLGILVLCGALVYFLCETAIYWFQISAENFVDDDFFQKYRPVENAWSAQKEHILLKNRIIAKGLKKSGSFKAVLCEELEINALTTSFDSIDRLTRMFITFIPIGETSAISIDIESRNADGAKLLTTSQPIPSGLLPESRSEERNYPLVSDPLKLLKIHCGRIRRSGFKQTPIFEPPIDDLNRSIDNAVAENIRLGIITPAADREEMGIFTPQGRYRLWLQTIKFNYLPFV